MARAPFQVLIIPFIQIENEIFFSIFQRQESSGGFWQWISGGGEDDESPELAAIRELTEEANITNEFSLFKLDSICTIQKDIYKGYENWAKDLFVVPEYAFAVEVKNKDITISDEHQNQNWITYHEAIKILRWDSNKTALWELIQRVEKDSLNKAKVDL